MPCREIRWVPLDNKSQVCHIGPIQGQRKGGAVGFSHPACSPLSTFLAPHRRKSRRLQGVHQNGLGLGLVLLLFSGTTDVALGQTGSSLSFEQHIQPILERNCGSCHGPQSHRSGLVTETMDSLFQGGALDGPAIIAGRSAESPLMLRLRGERQPSMPLGGNPLSADEIDRIARWIDQLAPSEDDRGEQEDQPGWPWTRLKEPEVPQVENQRWVTNPIDAFILAKLEAKGLSPAPPASRRAMLRRLYFSLIGLPPTPEDMAQFLDDRSDDAYRKAIQTLLADSRYGERWGRHWLDLVRYADTRGGGLEYPRPHMWRYRDYVIRAFNQDRPYDRFIQEQLAGDAYPGPMAMKEKSEPLFSLWACEWNGAPRKAGVTS